MQNDCMRRPLYAGAQMKIHPVLRATLGSATLSLAAACSFGMGGSTTDEDAGQLITAEQIRRSGASNGYDALRRLSRHLSFIDHERGPVRVSRRGRESVYLSESPMLIVDGVMVSSYRVLTSLPARDIESMRILTAAEGSLRHGMHAASGVIIVQTVHPDPAGQDTTARRVVGR